MKTICTLGIACMLIAFAAPAQASFTLIDNFDSYDNSTVQNVGNHGNGDCTNGVWDGMWDGTANALVLDDAIASDNSMAVYGAAGAWRGAETDLTNNFASDFSLADGNTATYFFQVMNEGGADADCMIGLAENVNRVDHDNSWQDFSVMPYVNGGAGSTSLKVYGNNNTGGTLAAMTDGEWYNVWVVVDNANKVFDMYYSTGTDDALTGTGITGIQFGRVTAPVNIEAFALSNCKDSRVHIDNLYMATGVDTSNPVPEPAGLALLALGGLAVLRKRS